MSGQPEPEPYYQAIEEAFNRRRGAPLLLSPRDWGLIGEWQRAGVPLRVVLQGIENCFEAHDRRGPAARRINSLSYCRQEVAGLHELYLGLRGVEAGRPPGEVEGGAPAPARDPGKVLARHLGRLQRRLKEAMIPASAAHLDPLVGAIAEAAAELRAIRRGLKQAPADPRALEGVLGRLDELMLTAAEKALPAEELRRVETDVEAALGDAGARMTPQALEGTRRAARGRLLRQHCGLPRLSLFD